MFALFTKVSWLVLQPSSLIAMALLVGLALLWRDRIGAARRWLGGGIAAPDGAGEIGLVGEAGIERVERLAGGRVRFDLDAAPAQGRLVVMPGQGHRGVGEEARGVDHVGGVGAAVPPRA